MKFYKRKLFWFFVIMAVLGIGGFFMLVNREKTPVYTTEILQTKNLADMVSETGKVVSDPKVGLRFLTNGELSTLNVKVGDKVQKGEELAVLENTKQQIAVNLAQAAFDYAVSVYDLKIAGTTPEDLAVSKAAVESAKVNLAASQATLDKVRQTTADSINNARLAVEQAELTLAPLNDEWINKNIFNAYSILRLHLQSAISDVYNALKESDKILGVQNASVNDSFESYLSVRDFSLLVNAKNQYLTTKTDYEIANVAVLPLNANSAYEEVNNGEKLVQVALDSVNLLLSLTRQVLDNSVTSSDFSDTALTTHKTNIDAKKTTVSTDIKYLETYRQDVVNAKNSYSLALGELTQARQNLDNIKKTNDQDTILAELDVKSKESLLSQAEAALELKTAKVRAVDLAGLKANISQAQANLDSAVFELQKTTLISPVDGIVAAIDKEEGEVVNSATDLISLISDKIQLEVDIAESEIEKVKVSQTAYVTFDAFSEEEKFIAKVISINPAETDISGVIYYKVKLFLEDSKGKDIKPGMTVNIDIEISSKDNVLAIPSRVIISKNNAKFVNVLDKNKQKQEVQITTGFVGDNGYVEVLSGLRVGDELIIFEQK